MHNSGGGGGGGGGNLHKKALYYRQMEIVHVCVQICSKCNWQRDVSHLVSLFWIDEIFTFWGKCNWFHE